MELTLPESTDRAFRYVSCIKINGRPILPPLMTSLKRQEMAEYRRQAAIAETRIIRRKIERAHQLWEKRNNKLTLSTTSLDIKDTNKYESGENNFNLTYSRHCRNKVDFGDISKNQVPYRNHSFSDVSNKIWFETEYPSLCGDSNQAFNNSQCFNYCDSLVYHIDVKEMPFVSDHNNKNNNSLNISSSCIEQDVIKKDNGVSPQTHNCDNGLVITEESNAATNNEIQECNFDTDTDTTVISVEQSTDLEKYLDNSIDTPTTNSVLHTPLCQYNEKSTENKSILNCSCSSLNTTLCPSLEGSNETLVPQVQEKSDIEENDCEAQVNPYNANCDFNSATDNFTSASENNIVSAMRCHVRRSSYTLDEPSPALMLAMEDSHQADLPDNPHDNEECNKNDSSITAENQEREFIDSASLQKSQIVQDNLDTEIAVINNNISTYNLCDNQNNDLSEIMKCNNNNNSKNQFKVSCLENTTYEYEKNCDTGQNRIMVTMKETMEKLFKEQEKNFESARKRLSELHQQQMVKLLARQNEQWQRLLEEEANEEFDESSHQNPVHEKPDPRIVSHNNVIYDKSLPTDNNINDNVNKQTAIPEIRIENASEDHSDIMKPKNFTPDMQLKFSKVSAAAKGYLTRCLMKSERVQRIIQTIKDTLICAMRFHQETPIKKGRVTEKDAELHKRLITQLTAACYELHDVFFKLTTKEKMEIIRQTREKKKKNFAELPDSLNSRKCLSNATLKVLERKKSNKSSTDIDTIEGKKLSSKYCFKAFRSSESTSNILKLPSRRGNAPSARSSHSPPVRKYARQTSPKQDFQKATRKVTPARKRLLENNMNQKR